ncbi:hypothetical protein Patl1_29706 [Pistacia atlantica]|uniref:Uncharacterized protein n=1 Tax=Pistacia atlantica TaxID=434234 RepID=A0ACC1AB37_9ROSI|nr:hypothetical protein Patl1_29706 [Pistacia atlantica]
MAHPGVGVDPTGELESLLGEITANCELESLWGEVTANCEEAFEDYMYVNVEYSKDSDEDMVEEEDEDEYIDAYCLERKISQAYEQQIDPQQCQKLAEEVLKILAEGDIGEVETNLLELFQYEKFSFIRFLLNNRLKIVSCTHLARSEETKRLRRKWSPPKKCRRIWRRVLNN